MGQDKTWPRFLVWFYSNGAIFVDEIVREWTERRVASIEMISFLVTERVEMLRGEYEISVYLLRLLLDICTYVLNGPTIPRASNLFIQPAPRMEYEKWGRGERRIYPDGDYLFSLASLRDRVYLYTGYVKSRSTRFVHSPSVIYSVDRFNVDRLSIIRRNIL